VASLRLFTFSTGLVTRAGARAPQTAAHPHRLPRHAKCNRSSQKKTFTVAQASPPPSYPHALVMHARSHWSFCNIVIVLQPDERPASVAHRQRAPDGCS